MAKLTITEAIKRSPIGKTYFYKQYVDTGKITVSVDHSGKKYIDSSELLRVFGELKGEPTEQPVNVHEQFTVNDTEQLVNVHKQPAVNTTEQSNLSSSERQEQAELVKALREQIEDLKADKQFYQSQIVSLTNRLEAPAKAAPINPLVRWWRSLG
jgi:hypothetical protein